jgi:hypothetical protein
MAHRLPDTFQSTQRAKSGQHMRLCGALLASRLDPATFPKLLPQAIEQPTLGSMGEQTTSKLGEQRVG